VTRQPALLHLSKAGAASKWNIYLSHDVFPVPRRVVLSEAINCDAKRNPNKRLKGNAGDLLWYLDSIIEYRPYNIDVWFQARRYLERRAILLSGLNLTWSHSMINHIKSTAFKEKRDISISWTG
jgi:hypothetical protein